jgi:hypothetical protein
MAMITVPEAAALFTRWAEEGVTEGFLAVLTPDGHTVSVTGFEFADDWCVIKTERAMDVTDLPAYQIPED